MDEQPTTRLVAGRYRLLRRAGHGAMSEVHVARDEVLGRDVAIKLVRADAIGDAGSVERLEREARAIAGLQHPNVVIVHDALRDGPDAAIVMELVDGGTLADRLRDEAPMPWRQALALATEVARGLDAAHARGLVHRDVKPANVLLGSDGSIKVADFGIAGAMAASTQTTTVRGSIPYLAPEQARGDRPDPRTDVYALGCVLHEMLTGEPPFTGDTGAAIIGQHLHRDPDPPSRLVPDLPTAVDAVVLRMLATEPDQRHPDMGAVLADFERVLGGGAPAAAPLAPTAVLPDGPDGTGGAAGSLPPTTRVDRPVAADAPRRGRRGALAAVGAVMAAVVLLVAWQALGPQATEQAGAPTDPTDAPTDEATEEATDAATDAATGAAPAQTEAPTGTTPATEDAPEPPQRPESVDDAAAAFRQILADGRAEGVVSAKAVEQLDEQVTKVIEKDREDKPGDVQKEVNKLRELIDEQVEKAGITSESLAQQLHDAAQDVRRVA